MRRLGITCGVCGKELSGGLDTYGAIGAEVCQEHYFDPPANEADNDDELRDLLKTIDLEFDDDTDLDDAIEKAQDAFDEADSEASFYQRQRDKYEEWLGDLKTLRRGRRTDDTGKRKLERWKAAQA